MLTTHCGVCKRAVSKATETVKERIDILIDDQWKHKNQYVLPFLTSIFRAAWPSPMNSGLVDCRA